MTDMYTLRPGLLVSMNTSVKGNVHYGTEEIEGSHLDELGRERARWETTRIVADPVEQELAIKTRTKIRSTILSVCSVSAFGLLCPNSKQQALTDAISTAHDLADEFNKTAKLTRIRFSIIYGRIAQDDIEAVRAITGEIRGLMEDMQRGVKTLDVKEIRAAAVKAKQVGEMLSPDAKGQLEVAITAARAAASKIVKAGETAAVEVDKAALRKISKARTAFLDIDIENEAKHVQAPKMDGRALDFAV